MTAAPIVRPATPSDAAALAHVQVTNYHSAYAPYFPPGFWDGVTEEEQTADWTAWTQEHPDDVLLVAQGSGTVSGYVLARLHPFHGTDSEVIALHVLPQDRGRGFGAALLRAALTALHGQGARSVGLSTHSANPVRAWYGALGGQMAGTVQQDLEGFTLWETVYVWPSLETLLARLNAPASAS